MSFESFGESQMNRATRFEGAFHLKTNPPATRVGTRVQHKARAGHRRGAASARRRGGSLVDFHAGTICQVKDSKGECNTDRGLNNCLDFDGTMNGDFYKVVQAGNDCPYLEYVDPDNCPDVSYDNMPRCEDPCLCEVRVRCPSYRNGVASTACGGIARETLSTRARRRLDGVEVDTHRRDVIDATGRSLTLMYNAGATATSASTAPRRTS